MSEWQPIETAPKDGKWILLYDSDEGPTWPREMIARWRDDDWRGEGVGGSIAVDPTHWMLLPEPPEES